MLKPKIYKGLTDLKQQLDQAEILVYIAHTYGWRRSQGLQRAHVSFVIVS